MKPEEELDIAREAMLSKKFDSTWTIARKKFTQNKIAMVSLLILIFIFAFSFLGPFIFTEDVTRVHLDRSNMPPSADNWWGTDINGRDIFLRTMHGGKTSLVIGLVSMFGVTIIGSVIGAIAGYFGGIIDSIMMRFTDFILTIPFMVFIIVLNAIMLSYEKVTGVGSLIIVFSFLGWGSVARIVRSKILSEKENEYVLAAQSIGTKPRKVITRHLIPNVMTVIIVQASLLLAYYIVAEAGLSFIGVGVPPDIPSWGNMLMDARQTDVLKNKPWIWVPPAIAITLTILCINFVGEGLKDAFDPRTTK